MFQCFRIKNKTNKKRFLPHLTQVTVGWGVTLLFFFSLVSFYFLSKKRKILINYIIVVSLDVGQSYFAHTCCQINFTLFCCEITFVSIYTLCVK